MKLKPRPLRTLFALLFMAAVTACLILLLPEEKTAGWFFTAFLLVLSALGTLLCMVNLLPGSSSLELTPAGMTVRSLYRDAFFAWTDIREFFTESTYLGRQVRWKFTDDYRARIGTRDLATRFTAFRATLPDTYGRRADQLVALLDEWRLKGAPAPAIPTAPAPEDKPLPGNWTVAGRTMTITLDPQAAQARHRRGVELTLAGRMEEALAELTEAQKLDPLSYDIQLDKAVALRFLERFPEALEVCGAAMAVLVIPPATRLLFYQLRGDVLREQGQLEAALESFQRSLDLHPEPRYAVHPHRQKALLLNKLGRRQEAGRARS